MQDHGPTTTGTKVAWYAYKTFCILIFAFLILPILAVVPLSFSALPFFAYTPEMLRLEPSAFSTQWYKQVLFGTEWRAAFFNTMEIGLWSTVMATAIGTLAALGLERSTFRGREVLSAIFLLPIFAPTIVLATGLYFLYAELGLLNTKLGIILAHATISAPFVMLSVRASLSMIDSRLMRAAANLGAGPVFAFRSVTLPLAMPGIIGGAILAFATSFDELVIVLFVGGVETTTIPRQMWTGVREDLSPRVLAVSSLMAALAIGTLILTQLLRRSARLPGK